MLDAHFTFSREWKAFPLAASLIFTDAIFPRWLLRLLLVSGTSTQRVLCTKLRQISADIPTQRTAQSSTWLLLRSNEPKYRTIQQKTRVKGQGKVWSMHKGGCLPGPVRGLGFPRTKYHPCNRPPRVPYYVAKRNTANT